MAAKARIKPGATFDAQQMERYWTLENAFLAAFAEPIYSWEIRRNCALLSAVMFGGLLDPNLLRDLSLALGKKLKDLVPGGRLPEDQARSTLLNYPDRRWFADPLTQKLLRRRVPNPKSVRSPENDGSELSDYARLIRLDESAFIEEVCDWILPAATTKARLFWPSLVVEHCTGALQSVSLRNEQWRNIDRRDVFANYSLSKTNLDPIRTVRPDPKSRNSRYYWFKDKSFHFIRAAIVEAIDSYAKSENPVLRLEQDRLRTCLEKSRSYFNEDELGWRVHDWFLQYCPAVPLRDGQRSTPRRARTLLDHAFTLGFSVDWSGVLRDPWEGIDQQAVAERLHTALKDRPEGWGAARRLYAFLGLGTLPRPERLPDIRQGAGVKNEVLSGPEFDAVLSHLFDRSDKRGSHWLAAMLMFRCGLRPREIVALEIDHITIVNDVVELRVAATRYIALKNKTSGRVLPLHALLSVSELAELLKWRAVRIRDCKGNRKHARLLFATVYHPDDYDYLLEPIEGAIRRALRRNLPNKTESKKPSYIFARCSILRHSFVSYAVATMLYPRDDGGFELPPGITPDLVSLARRERLERALLSEGHLGLSSLEAVRQMTGHARYQRTIGTYTHLMDLVAGAYAWRRSCEPSLPAGVLCEISEPKSNAKKGKCRARRDNTIRPADFEDTLNEHTLSHYARQQNEAEHAEINAAISALRSGQKFPPLVVPRTRRPRGKRYPPWMPQGNAFLSQFRAVSSPVALEEPKALPEWRRDDVDDWRTADQIVQMASRGIPARLIADEVGVHLVHVERLARRYHQLLGLRRRATARGDGKLRHALLLENPDSYLDLFDGDAGCWYSPLKPVRSTQHDRADAIWGNIQDWRNRPTTLARVRQYLCKHQSGRLLGKRRKPLELISEAFNGLMVVQGTAQRYLTSPTRSSFIERKVREEKPPCDRSVGLDSHDVPARNPKKVARLRMATLLHLLLLAEAASQNELPVELIIRPAAGARVNVAKKIAKAKRTRERKKQAAEETRLRAIAAAKKAKNASLRKAMQERNAGKLDFKRVVIASTPPDESPQAKSAKKRESRRALLDLK